MIEGKDQDNGFEAAVRDDFKSRINPNLRYPNIVSPIANCKHISNKGDYICIKTDKTHT